MYVYTCVYIYLYICIYIYVYMYTLNVDIHILTWDKSLSFDPPIPPPKNPNGKAFPCVRIISWNLLHITI